MTPICTQLSFLYAEGQSLQQKALFFLQARSAALGIDESIVASAKNKILSSTWVHHKGVLVEISPERWHMITSYSLLPHLEIMYDSFTGAFAGQLDPKEGDLWYTAFREKGDAFFAFINRLLEDKHRDKGGSITWPQAESDLELIADARLGFLSIVAGSENVDQSGILIKEVDYRESVALYRKWGAMVKSKHNPTECVWLGALLNYLKIDQATW